MRFELINLDVWGNATDGYEVNQISHTGRYVEIPDAERGNDDVLVKALKKAAMLRDTVTMEDIDIKGNPDVSLGIYDVRNNRPEFELVRVED